MLDSPPPVPPVGGGDSLGLRATARESPSPRARSTAVRLSPWSRSNRSAGARPGGWAPWGCPKAKAVASPPLGGTGGGAFFHPWACCAIRGLPSSSGSASAGGFAIWRATTYSADDLSWPQHVASTLSFRDGVLGRARKGKKTRVLGEAAALSPEEFAAMELDAKAELIQALIPLRLKAVPPTLEAEPPSGSGSGTVGTTAGPPWPATARTGRACAWRASACRACGTWPRARKCRWRPSRPCVPRRGRWTRRCFGPGAQRWPEGASERRRGGR